MKVTGPLCSIDASGTLGDVITAGRWRGRQFFKMKSTPRTAYTQPQKVARAKIGFLKAAWARLDTIGGAGSQAAWSAITNHEKSSAYHTFISTNLARWDTTHGPIVYPGGGSHTVFNTTTLNRATGADWWGIQLGYFNNAAVFGVAVYLQAVVNFPPLITDLVFTQVFYPRNAIQRRVLIQPIAPGTWTLSTRTLCTDGSYGGGAGGFVHTFP